MHRSDHQIVRTTLLCIGLAVLALFGAPQAAHSQDSTPSPVLVEAIGQANVRSGPGIEYDVIGQIVAGEHYPAIGRSARFPWFLIQLPTTQAWVYADLVKVQGNSKALPIMENAITPGPSLTPTASSTTGPDGSPAAIAVTPTAPVSAANVMVEAISTTNVRYGPGTDFRRVGTISKGQQYAVLRRHSQFDWLEIAFDSSPSKRAWVYKQTVKITGNLFDVPATADTNFGYPTLTPTAIMVVTSAPPWTATPPAPVANRLEPLGNTIYNMLLTAHFDPGTERQGSVFIMDMATGQSISLNPGVAYSGVSMMKIPVMLAYYRKFSTPFSKERATAASNMMVCSRNESSNMVLGYMGDGDVNAGASYVTDTLHALGLKDTFLSRPFYTGVVDATPTPAPQPVSTIKTDADQISAEPDLFNQTTPAEMGWLLSAVFECAQNGTGPIITTFNGDVTMQECRQIINTMRFNKIGSLSEAGIPPGTLIAHKHGWSDDTHGDAAIIQTPGGNYVLVAILHNRTWLSSDESFPLVAEISRNTYNVFNPGAPMDKINLQPVPADCTFPDELVADLQLPEVPWTR